VKLPPKKIDELKGNAKDTCQVISILVLKLTAFQIGTIANFGNTVWRSGSAFPFVLERSLPCSFFPIRSTPSCAKCRKKHKQRFSWQFLGAGMLAV